MIVVLGVFGMLLLNPAASDTLCLDGSRGEGARLRRLVLAIAHERSQPGRGVLELHTRPLRSFQVRATQSSSDTLVIGPADPAESAPTIRLGPVGPSSWGGHLISDRDTLPVALRESAAAADGDWPVGHWSGVVGRNAVPFRLGVSVSRGPCGLLRATFDSPDQGQLDLPATAVRVVSDSVIVEARYMGLRLALARAERVAEAVFSQGHAVETLTFEKGRRVTESRRPQEPVRPYPYEDRELVFDAPAVGLRFAGTLTVPSGPGPHPGVVLLSGSGGQDRNETVAGHRPFLVLADHLTRLGFVVLRFDDRGTQRTPGSVLNSGLEDRVIEAAAALKALRAQPELDPGRIGLIGHSEGGYVAQLLAARDTTVRLVVMLAAPAVGGRDVLLAQRAALNRAGAMPAAEVALDSLMLERLFRVLDRRPPAGEMERLMDEALEEWVATLPDDKRQHIETVLAARTPAQDSASLVLWRSRWFQSLYYHDPRASLAGLAIPVLAVFGSLDLQVPPHPNVAAFESLGPEARQRVTLLVFPGVNHMLQRAGTGLPSEYVSIEETIAPPVLQAVGDWLRGKFSHFNHQQRGW